MKLKLLKDPDPRLRKICAPIPTIDDKVKELAEAMKKWIQDSKNKTPELIAVGAAAPQFGHLVQLFVIWSPQFEATLINPSIIKMSGSRRYIETCLSIPGRYFLVDRPKILKVRGLDLAGRDKAIKVHDTLAGAILHEVEHLGGILVDNIAITEVPKDFVQS